MSISTTRPAWYSKVLNWSHTTRNIEHLLYGAITIEALIIGVRYEKVVTTPAGLVAVVWEAVLGLSVAFFFAFALSHRLASPHPLTFGAYVKFLPIVLPLILVGFSASIGELLANFITPSLDSVTYGADFGIIVLCAVVTWIAALAHSLTRQRQVALVLVVVVFLTAVAEVKDLISH